ncbi:unnamed protein product [Gordionus sp. m RMFG-2023]
MNFICLVQLSILLLSLFCLTMNYNAFRFANIGISFNHTVFAYNINSLTRILAAPFTTGFTVSNSYDNETLIIPQCVLTKDTKDTSFITRDPNDALLTFITIGDTGGEDFHPYTSHIGRNTAKTLGLFANQNHPAFVFLLGDNFYPKGVINDTDSRFNTSFENLYNYPGLDIPWYAIAGAHDHYGNITAQMSYRSSKWNFPYLYYSNIYNISGKCPTQGADNANVIMQMVMIDTQVLCPTAKHVKKSFEKLKYINSNNKILHWKWLENTLSKSKADLLIVVGHQPIYSIAKHGPIPCLVKNLRQLFYKYNVSLYLSGHNHHLIDREESSGKTMNYGVFGSGSKLNVNRKTNRTSSPLCLSKFYDESKGGFGILDVHCNKSLTVYYENEEGYLVHHFILSPRIVF